MQRGNSPFPSLSGASGRPGASGMALALAPLGVAALLAGCLANGGDESLLVLKNVKATATNGGCQVTSSENEVALTNGSLDASVKTSYVFIAQLRSRITALAGQEDQRTIFVRGANVDLTFPSGSPFTTDEIASFRDQALTHFMAPFSGFVRPNGGISDVFFDLIPTALAEKIAAKGTFPSFLLLGTFTVVGTLGGGNVTSQQFQYPITVVNTGLREDKGPCLLLSSSFAPRQGNPCNVGQDGVTDCCFLDGNRVCPAVGMGE